VCAEKYDKLHTDEVKELVKLIKTMHNIRLRWHDLPKFAVLKRIMFATKINEEWSRPDIIGLEMMRRQKSDKPMTLFRRLVWGHVVCAAGTGIKTDVRDDGAGYVGAKFAPQWASAEQARNLCAELEEVRDELQGTGRDQTLCDRLYTIITKSVGASAETPSLAMSKAATKVHEFAGSDGAVARDRKRPRGTGGEKPEGGGKKAKKAKGVSPTPPRQQPTPTKPGSDKYPDEEGAAGPNGLPRKKGGNPSGRKCDRLANGGTCPFKFCSFSHA